jgi:hypothetical protein
VEELNHQTSETLEGPRDADRRRNLDQHALGRLNVYLEPSRFVDGGVQKGEETLYIRNQSSAAACRTAERRLAQT